MVIPVQFLINAFFVYIATIGFGIIVNVPRRSLNLGGLVGVAAWLIYYVYYHFIGGYVGANFFGTLAIGVLSLLAARHQRLPVILYNIPALVPLVPGGQAYQVMRALAMNEYGIAKSNLIQVTFIAGSIAAGFLVSEVVNQEIFNARHYISPKHYYILRRRKIIKKQEKEQQSKQKTSWK